MSFPASDAPAWAMGMEPDSATIEISNDQVNHRFEATGGKSAPLAYRHMPQKPVLVQTKVRQRVRGAWNRKQAGARWNRIRARGGAHGGSAVPVRHGLHPPAPGICGSGASGLSSSRHGVISVPLLWAGCDNVTEPDPKSVKVFSYARIRGKFWKNGPRICHFVTRLPSRTSGRSHKAAQVQASCRSSCRNNHRSVAHDNANTPTRCGGLDSGDFVCIPSSPPSSTTTMISRLQPLHRTK